MAQQRTCVVYKETEKSHLKLVGKLFDQVPTYQDRFGIGVILCVQMARLCFSIFGHFYQ